MGSFKNKYSILALSLMCVFYLASNAGAYSVEKTDQPVKDCFLFRQGEMTVKLPLALEAYYGDLTAEQNVEVTGCGGEYQLPLPSDFTAMVNKWLLEDSAGSSRMFTVSAYGLSFDVEINKLKNYGEAHARVYSIARLQNAAEVEKDLSDRGAALNFFEGYLSPEEENQPVHSGNLCPLLSPLEVKGRLWLVFPATSVADMCEEYR